MTRLAILCLLLAGCSYGQSYLRVPPTDSTPSISFCTSYAEMEAHVGADIVARLADQNQMPRGVCKRDENAIYILTNDADQLDVHEALVLCHELQHYADQHYHGSMWALLAAMGHNQHKPGKESQ